MGRYQARRIWSYTPSFTYPAESSTDICVTPNKSRSCYIQYLLSGQVPTAVYGRPSGHVLNGINHTACYDQPAKIKQLSYKASTKEKAGQQPTGHHTKTAVQPCIIMLHNNDNTE